MEDRKHPITADSSFEIVEFKELKELGVECYYIPNFLSKSEADQTFKSLQDKFPFHQEQTSFMGKSFQQPRLTRFMGDKNTSYYYSGHDRQAEEWIPEVEDIRDKLMPLTEKFRPNHPKYNVVLGNLYRDGKDYIAKHSDAETVHNTDCFIASFSLGAERDFDIWNKAEKKRILRIKLAHGSVLLMGRLMQNKTQHDLPKRLKIKEPRINLTFRYFQVTK